MTFATTLFDNPTAGARSKRPRGNTRRSSDSNATNSSRSPSPVGSLNTALWLIQRPSGSSNTNFGNIRRFSWIFHPTFEELAEAVEELALGLVYT
jgi:hypothetical protein